jgi:thiosulfate dehydrogenase [quinone] large subunit
MSDKTPTKHCDQPKHVTSVDTVNRGSMSFADNFKQPTYLGYIALVRIFVGYQFLIAGYAKLAHGFLQGLQLNSQLVKSAPGDPFAWHRALILGFVVPHAAFFSYLVAFGETAIGLSLLFGCLVRISSFFGAFHNANILFSIAMAAGGSTITINRTFILLHLVFIAASAGRSLGIDGLLKSRFPRSSVF